MAVRWYPPFRCVWISYRPICERSRYQPRLRVAPCDRLARTWLAYVDRSSHLELRSVSQRASWMSAQHSAWCTPWGGAPRPTGRHPELRICAVFAYLWCSLLRVFLGLTGIQWQ